MEFFAAICPQCSGNLQLPDDRDNVKCMYCGANIVIKEHKNNDVNIANILEIARTALSGGNYQEAHTQYNKVLESDINNIEAWIGKGKSSAHLSTLANYRGDEMFECFKKAIKISQPTEEHNATKILCASYSFEFAIVYEGISTRHAIQFMGVHNSRHEHWDRCKKIIELCDFSKRNDPDLKSINSFVQNLCKRNLNVSMMLPEEKRFFTTQLERFSTPAKIEINKTHSEPGFPIRGMISLSILFIIGLIFGYYGIKSDSESKVLLLAASILFLSGPSFIAYVSIQMMYEKSKAKRN